MTAILEKKPKTKKEILEAIIKIAKDKQGRLLKDDHMKWLETKLREISRLAGLL